MHGFGTFKWPDGRRYVGQFENDIKHGDGEFFLADGRIFKGQWKDGL